MERGKLSIANDPRLSEFSKMSPSWHSQYLADIENRCFNFGDTVRVVDSFSDYYDQAGRVLYISYDDENSPLEDNNYTVDFGNGKYETFNFRKLKLIKRATPEEHKAAIKDGNLPISDGWNEWFKLVREKIKELYREDSDGK
jgi:hypothetical protein